MKVNFVDLKSQCSDLLSITSDEIITALESGQFVGGNFLNDFENTFRNFHEIDHAIGVGSGTDALWLALLALGIGPGDEVLVPANTFIATAFAATHCGADVKFVDVDPETYVVTADILEKAISPKTKAIMPVHLYGQPCEMGEIMELASKHNLKVVEDCAQAIGAFVDIKKVGTFGDAGCFSFYPTKNLGGMAQGGAVITNSKEIAEKIRSIGNVGRTEGSWFDYSYVGMNSRLDSINALFLNNIIKYEYLMNWISDRVHNALFYNSLLEDCEEIKTPPAIKDRRKIPVFHLYEIKCKNKEIRDSLKEYLDEKEIGTGLHYPVPCHKQPIYNTDDYLPVSEELADTLLSLPMHPYLSAGEIEYVCSCIKEFFK